MDAATVAVYERRAGDWRAARAPAARDDPAARTAARVGAAAVGGAVVDLGCGPGFRTAALGPDAVALDAALGMLRLVPDAAPGVPRVRADLARLPFRRGALGGGVGDRSYVHLDRRAVPRALAELHRACRPGAPVALHLFGGDSDLTTLADDDFPGRRFSLWPEPALRDVVEGAGFALDELAVRRDARGDEHLHATLTRSRTLPDWVGPDLRLLVVGLNPSLFAADAGVGFARPGNRFWPAALDAGLVSRDRDPIHALDHHGVGMTDLVKRATPRAAELRPEEYRRGRARLERLCAWLRPAAVCVVGLAGWRAAVDRRAVPGEQAVPLGGRPVYLMPSTSGLNASSTLAELADHLAAASRLAGPRIPGASPP